MSKKKIAIMHHCGEIGGAGKSLFQTVSMLSETYDITVCVPENSQMSDFLESKGVKIIPYAFPLGSVPYYSGGPKVISRTFFKEVFHLFSSRKERIELLKKCDADIIMINSATECVLARDVKKHTNAAAICFVRETLPKGNKGLFFNYLKKTFNKYCDGVFFISDFDRMAYNLGICNAITVKNTVPDSYFDDYEENKDEYLALLGVTREPKPEDFYILYLGGNSPLKGYSVICKAMEYLPSYVRLLLAGNNTKLRDAAISPILERTEQLGILEDVSNAYKACDLVVFPATSAHQGRPIFEAGAFGKAVVASDFEEIKEDLRDGINGATFTPSDATDLALGISSFIEGNYRGKSVSALADKNKSFSRKNHSIAAVKSVLEKGVLNTLTSQNIKNLHILSGARGLETSSFIKLINDNFDDTEHFFIVVGKQKEPNIIPENYANVLLLPKGETTEQGILLAYAKKAQKIFWHTLPASAELCGNILKNSALVLKSSRIDRGENGIITDKKKGRSKISEYLRGKIYQKWCAKIVPFGKRLPYGTYTTGIINSQKPIDSFYSDTINIMADAGALPKLAHLHDKDIVIYVPLARETKASRLLIRNTATDFFGKNKVQFITEPMTRDEYVAFLWNIDVAVFTRCSFDDFDEICALSYIGKKTFIPKDSPVYEYFTAKNAPINDVSTISGLSIVELFTKEDEEHTPAPPPKFVLKRLTEETLALAWQKVFKGK